MPDLVWFAKSPGVYHAGYNDSFEPLCGATPELGEYWVSVEKPHDCCSNCAAAWYKANAAVGTIIEQSRVPPQGASGR